jgi:hypothetical protein
MNDKTHDAMAGPYQDERNDRRSSISGEFRPMDLMQDKLILVHAAPPSIFLRISSTSPRVNAAGFTIVLNGARDRRMP